MAKAFNIPDFYRADLISQIKSRRSEEDQRKRDLSPTLIDLGSLQIKLARHFGFCYGVQNAIEIAYRAVAENPGKRIFLLSEMIHNPQVNADLQARGVRFLHTTHGEELIPFEELCAEDIVIVPAFGTSLEMMERLRELGIEPSTYNTTCPFVEKVWKRAQQLGEKGYSIIIHGKHSHEETRATFSHARVQAPALVIRDLTEANILARFILGQVSEAEFKQSFAGRWSEGFEPCRDLKKLGVVNQTTMLAEETQAISDLLRKAMIQAFGEASLHDHFADTRDTLCYATSENQSAIRGLIAAGGDLALVVGGYNSSNTSHLAELLMPVAPTYYIKDEQEILSAARVRCLDLNTHRVELKEGWLPDRRPLQILLSAGASCPDAIVERVIRRLAEVAGVSEALTAWSEKGCC